MSRPLALVALAGLVLAAAPARAHEVLHELRRGTAVAVRATYADGEPMAYATCEVYSPADPKIPWQKGRTDRAGWVAFVPEVAGRWRVKVVDETGHGLDLEVEAGPATTPTAGEAPSALAFALRPLVGVVAIGAAFAALFLVLRRKGRAP